MADKGSSTIKEIREEIQAAKKGSTIKEIREDLQAAKQEEADEAERKLRRRANRIRKAMLRDLQERGLTAPKDGSDRDRGTIYTDMVEDYAALWITRERLEADISERGVTVMDEKRGLPVENCSVSARVRVSKQMTTIMQTMGYKDQAIKARRPEGDADEDL